MSLAALLAQCTQLVLRLLQLVRLVKLLEFGRGLYLFMQVVLHSLPPHS